MILPHFQQFFPGLTTIHFKMFQKLDTSEHTYQINCSSPLLGFWKRLVMTCQSLGQAAIQFWQNDWRLSDVAWKALKIWQPLARYDRSGKKLRLTIEPRIWGVKLPPSEPHPIEDNDPKKELWKWKFYMRLFVCSLHYVFWPFLTIWLTGTEGTG